jgi:hypothetical protein
MNGNWIMMNVFLALLPGVAASMSDTQPDICSVNERFVVKFFKPPLSQAKLCDLRSYEASGDDCESEYAGEYWIYEFIGDLNSDRIPDAIISNFSGGIWRGVKSYLILIGCSDGSYIRMFDGGLASLVPSKESDENGWSHLNATRQYPRDSVENGGDYHSFNSQQLTLLFNSETQKYVISKEGKILPMKGDDDVAIVDSKTNVPIGVDFIWDEFPRINSPKVKSLNLAPVQQNP